MPAAAIEQRCTLLEPARRRAASPQLRSAPRLDGTPDERIRHQRRDPATVHNAITRVADGHVIELEAELFRQHKAGDVQLGELQSKLDGLATHFREDERHQAEALALLRYQRRSAMRSVEDRNTPMPAGPDGVEEDGQQHGNVGDLAGRTWRSQLILYVVLLLAMTAGPVTFRQVVERVVNESTVLPLVLAITAMTTYVAHKAGDTLKGAKEVYRTARRSVRGWGLFGTWVVMGSGMFAFRLLAPVPVADDVARDYASAGGATSAGDDMAVWSAVLLLLLYVLTGAIAIAAGYGRPRPEVEQYRRTNRIVRRREPRLAALRRALTETESLHRQLADLRASREEQYKMEVGRCEGAAVRVKAEAAILVRHLLRAAELSWLQRLRGGHYALDDDRPVPGFGEAGTTRNAVLKIPCTTFPD